VSGNNLSILAKGTYIRGEVFSEDLLVVEGGFEGNLVGERVIIKSSGHVQGDLNCRSLSIEHGGILNGDIRVLSDLAALPDPNQPDPVLQQQQDAPQAAEISEPSLGEPDPDNIMDVEDLKVDDDEAAQLDASEPSVLPEGLNAGDEIDDPEEQEAGDGNAKGKKNKGRFFGGSLFKK
jgi:hypothetical protein